MREILPEYEQMIADFYSATTIVSHAVQLIKQDYENGKFPILPSPRELSAIWKKYGLEVKKGGAHHFNGRRKKGDMTRRVRDYVGEKTWERHGNGRRYVGRRLRAE